MWVARWLSLETKMDGREILELDEGGNLSFLYRRILGTNRLFHMKGMRGKLFHSLHEPFKIVPFALSWKKVTSVEESWSKKVKLYPNDVSNNHVNRTKECAFGNEWNKRTPRGRNRGRKEMSCLFFVNIGRAEMYKPCYLFRRYFQT